METLVLVLPQTTRTLHSLHSTLIINSYYLASFPGLPCFYLLFVLEWKTSEKQGRPGSIHHKWTQGKQKVGRGRYSNVSVPNLKVSFLLVMTSSFNHAEVWSPKLWQSTQTDNLVRCFSGWTIVSANGGKNGGSLGMRVVMNQIHGDKNGDAWE